jgi:ribosome-associated protein YbcJ (S4-like RNA binding protein)
MKRIYYISLLLMLLACEKEPVSNKADYSEQPTIPMYSQLLLNGPVSYIKDEIVTRLPESFTAVEEFGFGESYALEYYTRNGEERGSRSDLCSTLFTTVCTGYAYFVFPEIWQQSTSAIDYHPEYDNGVLKRIEYSWDESGRFTEILLYENESLVTVDGEVCTMRGKKLRGGEVVSFNGETVKVAK